MSRTSAPQSRRTRQHAKRDRLPLEFRMMVRFVHCFGTNIDVVLSSYADVDTLAQRLIAQPGGATDRDFQNHIDELPPDPDMAHYENEARQFLTTYFKQNGDKHSDLTRGQEAAAANEIVESVTRPQANNGFMLGLCVGYRLTRAAAGKDDAQ